MGQVGSGASFVTRIEDALANHRRRHVTLGFAGALRQVHISTTATVSMTPHCGSASLWIMSLTMTPAEREAFLAEVHVAVVTVADDDGRGPLAIPLWYDYQPGGEIILVTDGNSRKAQLIRKAGRVTVCAQTQEMPYRYASVEGPVTAIEDTVTVEQRWELARRYLGHEGADGYIEATRDVTDRMCAIHIRPEHWLTRDYTKAGG
jgi:nitroimidazol reductase NimA-like FMN-containing flavoprotein (pyridoxamine 5'-phosphate oxidase superfamily)